MNLPVIVEVAIGLAFLYLLLSLLCTTINEIIATVMDVRAKHLEKSIATLIDNEELRKLFYSDSVFASAKSAVTAIGSKYRHPAYVDAGTFATSVLTSVLKQTAANPAAVLDEAPTIDEIRKAINDLPESRIKTVLQSQLAGGVRTVEELRSNVADWFDASMARLSGVYKRHLSRISLVVGFCVAAFFNADSISVGRQLGENSALRQMVVDNAEALLPKLEASLATPCSTDPQKIAERLSCQTANLKEETSRLLPLPLGWSSEVDKVGLLTSLGPQVWAGAGWLALKLAGLLATALALSLGAPFWFDVLQSFMKFRNTGPKPLENAALKTATR